MTLFLSNLYVERELRFKADKIEGFVDADQRLAAFDGPRPRFHVGLHQRGQPLRCQSHGIVATHDPQRMAARVLRQHGLFDGLRPCKFGMC